MAEGKEGAERQLRGFPELRKGGAGPETSWREAKVQATAQRMPDA